MPRGVRIHQVEPVFSDFFTDVLSAKGGGNFLDDDRLAASRVILEGFGSLIRPGLYLEAPTDILASHLLSSTTFYSPGIGKRD